MDGSKSHRLNGLYGLLLFLGIAACAALWTSQAQSRAGAAKGGKSGLATKYDRQFNNVYFKVPPGYRAVQNKDGVVMIPNADLARGEIEGFLVITQGLALGAQARAKLKAAGKSKAVEAIALVMGGFTEGTNGGVSPPQLANDPAKDGYEGYLLVSKLEDRNLGKTRFAQHAIYLTGDRAEVAMRVAYGSQQRLDRLGPGFDALLQSIEFGNAGAAPPVRRAPPLPTDLAAITPKPKPNSASPSGKGGQSSAGSGQRRCRIIQRQYCTAGAAAGLGAYSCSITPTQICS